MHDRGLEINPALNTFKAAQGLTYREHTFEAKRWKHGFETTVLKSPETRKIEVGKFINTLRAPAKRAGSTYSKTMFLYFAVNSQPLHQISSGTLESTKLHVLLHQISYVVRPPMAHPWPSCMHVYA